MTPVGKELRTRLLLVAERLNEIAQTALRAQGDVVRGAGLTKVFRRDYGALIASCQVLESLGDAATRGPAKELRHWLEQSQQREYPETLNP